MISDSLYQHISKELEKRIAHEIVFRSKLPDKNAALIKRLKLYQQDPTKKSSLQLRLAATISLYDLEDFGFIQDDLLAVSGPAALSEDGFLRMPEVMVMQGYTQIGGSSIFDDECAQVENAPVGPLSVDHEILYLQKGNENCKLVVDPVLYLLAEEL